jgi:hypothetical protein
MGVSGQRDARAALYPRRNDPGTHCTGRRLGGPHSRSGHRGYSKKCFCLCRGSNLDQQIVQSVVRHCTDWAPLHLPTSSVISTYIFLQWCWVQCSKLVSHRVKNKTEVYGINRRNNILVWRRNSCCEQSRQPRVATRQHANRHKTARKMRCHLSLPPTLSLYSSGLGAEMWKLGL